MFEFVTHLSSETAECEAELIKVSLLSGLAIVTLGVDAPYHVVQLRRCQYTCKMSFGSSSNSSQSWRLGIHILTFRSTKELLHHNIAPFLRSTFIVK